MLRAPLIGVAAGTLIGVAYSTYKHVMDQVEPTRDPGPGMPVDQSPFRIKSDAGTHLIFRMMTFPNNRNLLSYFSRKNFVIGEERNQELHKKTPGELLTVTFYDKNANHQLDLNDTKRSTYFAEVPRTEHAEAAQCREEECEIDGPVKQVDIDRFGMSAAFFLEAAQKQRTLIQQLIVTAHRSGEKAITGSCLLASPLEIRHVKFLPPLTTMNRTISAPYREDEIDLLSQKAREAEEPLVLDPAKCASAKVVIPLDASTELSHQWAPLAPPWEFDLEKGIRRSWPYSEAFEMTGYDDPKATDFEVRYNLGKRRDYGGDDTVFNPIVRHFRL